MGKRWKLALMIAGALLAMIAFVVWWFMHRFSAETSVMTPAPTGLVVDQVYAIKDEFVNMYLVGDSDRYIAIDAGKDLSVVQNELSKLGVDPEQVEAVLLTHTDMDHVAALPLFRKIVSRDTAPGAITGGANCFVTDGGVDTVSCACVGSSLLTPSALLTALAGIVLT